MAVVSVHTAVSTKGLLGGVAALPVRSRCPCASFVPSVASRSRSWNGALLKQRSRTVASSRPARLVIVSEQREEGNSNSKVFKSMQDAAERMKEDGSSMPFDAADIARAVSDAERLASSKSRDRTLQPPRFATLRAFGETGGEGVMSGGFEGTSVFELIAANVEASKQVKNWEVLSGRLAMLAIFFALGVELFTGNSVFDGVDAPKLEAVAGMCAVATLSAAGFAYAWRAKTDVVTLMTKGYKNMLESALDNVIDGIFFDES